MSPSIKPIRHHGPISGYRGIVSVLIFFIYYPAMLSAISVPQAENTENQFVETGYILLNRAIERYWEADGTQIGNLGLLNRASRSFAYISDPAIRYLLLAEVELYKGRTMLEIKRRSKARRYFQEAMRLAKLSISYMKSSEALRVQAEAGYAWLYSKRFRLKTKMKRDIREWSRKSLLLDPSNHVAEVIQVQIELRNLKRNDEKLTQIRSRLEGIESTEGLEKVFIFRTRILLAQVNQLLDDEEMQAIWCNKALEIYPNNALGVCRTLDTESGF